MTWISNVQVPDEGDENAKVLFVGESPGVDEEKEGRPFIGASGNLLETCLGRNGIQRSTVRLANLCHYRPEGNKFELLLGTPQLATGIKELVDYIRLHKESINVICPLGNWPLWFLTGKRGKEQGTGITRWRGSILSCSVEGLEDVKVIPTFHPAAVLRERVMYPIFDMDIKRVFSDSQFKEKRLPERKFVIAPKGDELEYWTQELLKADKLAVDIENVKNSRHLLCVGFASSPQLGVCIEYNEHDPFCRDAISRLLLSNIPKLFHFGTHDTEVLRLNGYEVNNYFWDTIIAQHVMWPELPRALAYITSVYTREPYYKDEVSEDDPDTKAWSPKVNRAKLYAYNCKDTTCTFECHLEQEKEINEGPKGWRKFFDFEMEELEAAHTIMQAGIYVDQERRKKISKACDYKYAEMQGYLNRLVGAEINARSHVQVKSVLYEGLGLPKKFKRDKDGKNKLTSDENALVALIILCKEKIDTLSQAKPLAEWRRKFLILKFIIMIRGLLKLKSSYIDIGISDDGRLRGRFKVPGAETGRWAAEKYIDGTGCGPQTFPRGGIELTEAEEKIIDAA